MKEVYSAIRVLELVLDFILHVLDFILHVFTVW